MENVRKHRNIKLETTERRRSYLVSEQIITLKGFSQNMYLQYICNIHEKKGGGI